MIKSFQEGKDIYGSIASIAFEVPYEECLEFHPVTGEYQPHGKKRRSEAKTIVLGICYGRSVTTIAEQLYGKDDSLTTDEKTAKAQHVYDSVLLAFPALRALMNGAQATAKQKGYVETILGRRRHIPDMQLPPYDFKAMTGYVNPDVDPLDIATLNATGSDIPERIVEQLKSEFAGYKYYGQIVKRTKELQEEKIRVINNTRKISDASRKCVNCVDYDTEILTVSGWKRYCEVEKGTKILSYNLEDRCIESDHVSDVHIYPGETDVIEFETPTFSAVSTPDHRWVCEWGSNVGFITTEHIDRNVWPDYPILRISDNRLNQENLPVYEEQFHNWLKVVGWFLTDGCRTPNVYGIHLYQSTSKVKNSIVYFDMVSTLNALGIPFTDYTKDDIYHEIYLKKCDFTAKIYDLFPDRCLTYDFISSLTQNDAEILLHAMLQGDGSGVDGDGQFTEARAVYTCNSKEKCDLFQYLCVVAGYASNSYMVSVDSVKDNPSFNKRYDSTGNLVQTRHDYYEVCVLKLKRAQIYPHHKKHTSVDGVWCVTTGNGTWIARRHGKVYITGNSIIQGSAAEQTKMAMLMIESNEEWKAIGGRLLLPVHDELIAEVPIENYKRGAELLSQMMCDAANFLPFDSKCDVEITYRWYGLSYPCKYPQPESLSDLSDDERKWVQYHLFEAGYQLPNVPHEDGSDLRGDEAMGISGKVTDEYEAAIQSYMNRYNIKEDDFINHIHTLVHTGKLPE